ncbi:arf-GAP with Rho-GAP domain, ANK repeat and PH domain-containing protein 1-like [Sceloporus undulatus]|uniref:arf-GAP with Rho-GAP domain, ANK repeat and PH domain-containing protein 1-like n=1 Tax=Sceloporus undulatus TaxID=8520 RepID=UPI001C4DD2E0|nr:arf-GAP with Rho-GAP domain, ANK repeat and PH domain-containing protein 1-like [Sceloporus undulatus]
MDATTSLEKHYSVLLPSVAHNGFLYKAPSVAKPSHERKAREEFSRRWCRLHDGVLSYYESNTSTVPNGEIRMQEIVSVVNNPPETHGFTNTFEVFVESERLYLFGLDSPEGAKEWVKCIAKVSQPDTGGGLWRPQKVWLQSDHRHRGEEWIRSGLQSKPLSIYTYIHTFD